MKPKEAAYLIGELSLDWNGKHYDAAMLAMALLGEREPLVQEVIAAINAFHAKVQPGHEEMTAVFQACRKLAEWKP